MRKTILWIFTLIALMLSSCSPAIAPSAGIRITNVSEAVGGAEGSAGQQVVSYKVTLQNATQNDLVLRWIEPVLPEKVSARLVDDSPRVSVDKTLGANSSLIVDGQFRFDASGMTKEQIARWEPLIKGVVISTEINLSSPPQAGE